LFGGFLKRKRRVIAKEVGTRPILYTVSTLTVSFFVFGARGPA